MKLLNIKDDNLYYIGGIVRDMILGQEYFDIDITYIGDAISYSKTIPNIKILKINKAFGTVRILVDNQEVDLASTRDEIYEKAGHLPKVTEIGCSLKQDVLRRDFTINTLAKSLNTGEIIDYLNGMEDIKNKIIKVIHDNSFIDDPTRIVRALKFSVRFGFKLEPHTQKLQEEYLGNINYDMSYKRLKKEITETFNLNKQEVFLRFFDEKIYKLLTKQNTTAPKYNIQELISKYPVNNIWIVYLGWMDLTNLPLTKKEMKIISDYNKLKSSVLKDDYSIYSAFKNAEKESILLYAITIDDKPVMHYLDKLSKIKLTISGNDIKKLGINPSKKYAECMEYVLKEKIKNPKVNELKLIQQFFS